MATNRKLLSINLNFSKWYSWQKRNQISGKDSSGVYIIAKSPKPPNCRANPRDKNIIYIGESCSRTLKQRWSQFNYSMMTGRKKHSGGISYYHRFGDEGKNLYVAALPIIDYAKNLQHLLIRYIERKLILDYALKYGSAPKLNHK